MSAWALFHSGVVTINPLRSISSYYDKYPEPIDQIARQIGYRVLSPIVYLELSGAMNAGSSQG